MKLLPPGVEKRRGCGVLRAASEEVALDETLMLGVAFALVRQHVGGNAFGAILAHERADDGFAIQAVTARVRKEGEG